MRHAVNRCRGLIGALIPDVVARDPFTKAVVVTIKILCGAPICPL